MQGAGWQPKPKCAPQQGQRLVKQDPSGALLDQLDGLHQKTPETRLLNLAGVGAMGEDEQHLEVPTKELRGDPANRYESSSRGSVLTGKNSDFSPSRTIWVEHLPVLDESMPRDKSHESFAIY